MMTRQELADLPVGEVIYAAGTVWHKIKEVNHYVQALQVWRGEARSGVWTDGAVWALANGDIKLVGNTRG